MALEDLYGGTYRFLEVLVEEGAYQVDFVRGEEGLRRALADPASLVVIETPTNRPTSTPTPPKQPTPQEQHAENRE